MTPTITPDLYGDLVQVASQPGFRDWQAMVRNTGGCAEPVHLWGESRTIHTGTGEAPRPTRARPAAGRLRQPAQDPLPVVLGDLPGRHLPAHQSRTRSAAKTSPTPSPTTPKCSPPSPPPASAPSTTT